MIDELPIFVNRMLRGDDDRITPDRKRETDVFLGWFRKNGQEHRGRICLILMGSVSLEPILRQVGLGTHANIYSPLDLKPWDEETALACLVALAETYGLELPLAARQDMCHRLRCLVPHHVQRFFDKLQEHLRRAKRRKVSLEDVAQVYTGKMLSVRGQVDMDHYESRLKLILGVEGHRVALAMLTEAAVSNGVLRREAIDQYHEYFRARTKAEPVRVADVLLALEHDEYLAPQGEDYRFASGLLEDWWRTRHGRHFVPIRQHFAPTRD